MDFTCPDFKMDQTVSWTPQGWLASTITENMPEADQITVFDGTPEQMASLVPDNEPLKEGESHVWTFEPERGRDIWVQCGYAKQATRLQRAIPKNARKCTQTAPRTLSCE